MMRRKHDPLVPLAALVLLVIATAIAEIEELTKPPSSRVVSTANPIGTGGNFLPLSSAPLSLPRAPFLIDAGKAANFRRQAFPQQFAFREPGLPAADDPPVSAAPAAEKNAPPPVPSLRADAALVHKLAAARDCMKDEAWVEAAYLLQSLLDHPEDVLVAVKRSVQDGTESACWTGIRHEAERLLGEFPAAGREFYNARYAPRAKALLAEARQLGDMNRIAEIARRYPTTAAGAEALQLLAGHHLDRARYQLAAVCFGRLLARSDSGTMPAAVWFQAALAFQRAGDVDRARQAWDRLAALAPVGIRLGERELNLAQLKRELESGKNSLAALALPQVEGYPGLESRWVRPTFHHSFTRTVMQAASQPEGRYVPSYSAFHALPNGDRVLYRSHRGVHAIDPGTGKDAWETPFAWSMDQMAAQQRFASVLEDWVTGYFQYSAHAMLENSVLGTLTSDGRRVFAVDDLALPPYRSNYRTPGRWRQEPNWPDFGAGLTEATYHNRLLALDAATGKPLWEAGGYTDDSDEGDLLGAYFLGPPLPIDGRLYGLVEKNSELSLVCLNASRGELLWKQPLAFAPTRLLLDPGRRLQASRPVFSQGVLVCPTTAGVVLAIDIATPGLLWAYPYRTQSLTQTVPTYERRGRSGPALIIAEWKSPNAFVAGDRVIFTAADEGSIHCVSLRDGSLLWKQPRSGDDLWVAGLVAGKLVVVGKRGCRALDPVDGRQVWRLLAGVPSGHGVARDHVYYLPLRETVSEQGPAICAIDVDRGQILARIPVPPKDLPGNLVSFQGELLSQSATALTAYTRLQESPKEEKESDNKPKGDKPKKDG